MKISELVYLLVPNSEIPDTPIGAMTSKMQLRTLPEHGINATIYIITQTDHRTAFNNEPNLYHIVR